MKKIKNKYTKILMFAFVVVLLFSMLTLTFSVFADTTTFYDVVVNNDVVFVKPYSFDDVYLTGEFTDDFNDQTGSDINIAINVPGIDTYFIVYPFGASYQNYEILPNRLPVIDDYDLNYLYVDLSINFQNATLTYDPDDLFLIVGYADKDGKRLSYYDCYPLQIDQNNIYLNDFLSVSIPDDAAFIDPYIYCRTEVYSDSRNAELNVKLNDFYFTNKISNDVSANKFISPLVNSSVGILSGIGKGAVNFFESIFISDEGGISSFGIYCLCFVGIGMAIGIMRWIRKKID